MPAVPPPSHDSIRFVTWNLHKGKSTFGRRVDGEQVGSALAGTGCAVAFLQEVQHRHDRESMLSWFEGNAGFSIASYAANAHRRNSTHGNAIVGTEMVQFDGWKRNESISAHRFEARGALLKKITIHGRTGLIASTHFALNSSGRRYQARRLIELLQEHHSDCSWCAVGGDFNESDRWLADMFERHGFQGSPGNSTKTFPSPAPFRALDKLYFKGATPIAGGVWSTSFWRGKSDHLPVWADVRLA